MRLCNRVAEFRATHRMSVEQLAQRAGVSAWTISHLEADPGYQPQGRVMVRLCESFRAELGTLFFIDWGAPDVPERDGEGEEALAGSDPHLLGVA